jgi:hypothetical protein
MSRFVEILPARRRLFTTCATLMTRANASEHEKSLPQPRRISVCPFTIELPLLPFGTCRQVWGFVNQIIVMKALAKLGTT